MNKLEEILCNVFGVDDLDCLSEAIEYEQHRTYDTDKIQKAMKEYAEFYAKKHEIGISQTIWVGLDDDGNAVINDLDDIKLPEHE